MSEEVSVWLNGLGLGQHADAFEKNAIVWSLIPKLNHELLKEIGINSVGHRMQILEAAAELDSEQPPATTEVEPPITTGEAERRQLTVMFCDLAGSTELSQQLDPEEMREINRAYQDACKAAIDRYEGYIARYMGDGVLAYFGYPQAHEDDAERAVHAGLSVVESVTGLKAPLGDGQDIELSVRVGIATGPVVVGDLIGEGASQESAVVGETPNLAARLQGLASKNSVVVSPGTYDLVGERFEYDDLGAHSLKGIAEPVHARRVIAPIAAESRFEAAHRAGLTSLVGREHEIGLLLERWAQAKEGDGQVVLLSGEAGIGKSRITETLRERTAGDGPVRLRYQCSPYYTNTALHPVIGQLERAAQFEAEDTNEIKLDKLESLLGRGTTEAEAIAPLIAPLLSLSAEGRYAPLEMTPERQKEQTLEALAAQMEGLGRHQPVLFIFEDVHWADPTSLELLQLTIEHVQSIPVLMVLTYRPEFSPPWSGHTHVTSLTLNRFTRNLASVMVENVTGGKPLPDEVLEQIIEKTDGVPLFVEELTKTILESGQLSEESNRYVASGPLLEVAIPSTLHDSLMARLDRLGAVKEVAQTAAAIGREFDYDLLAGVSPLSFAELRSALDELIDAELVFRRGRSQEGGYIFKHALVQDAAYESLLKRKRQDLHGRIAEVLKSRFPERAELEPELLAHHLTEADDIERAIGFWIKAGDRDIQRSASAEAVSHFRTALALIERLPHSDLRDEVELSIQAPLGAALTATQGYTAAETKAAYTRAYALCQQIGQTDQICHVMYGVWNYLFVGNESTEALELAEEGLRMAEDKQERLPHLVAHDWMGVTCFTLGRLEDAQAHLENALSLYDADEHRTLVYQCGEDPRYESANWLGLTSWVLGYPDRAIQYAKDAVAWAEELSYAPSIAYTLYFQVSVDLFRRDWQNVTKRTQELISFCTEQSIAHFRALGTIHRGAALIEQGDIRSGLESIEEGWRIWGSNRLVTTFYWLSAIGHWQLGDSETALQLLDDASALITRIDERFWEAEIHRLRGEIHRSRGPDFFQLGESCFNQALSVAQTQEAKSLELRAATSLARLWQGQGKNDEARELLGPIYEWFTEGFDTADLKEAKALLDELS